MFESVLVHLHGDYVVSVQYDGGFLPDIILLTLSYYHWRTYLTMYDYSPIPVFFFLYSKILSVTKIK